MSSRHLKKVFGAKEEELGLKNASTEDEDEFITPKGRNMNFALLNNFSEGSNEKGCKGGSDYESDGSGASNSKLANKDEESEQKTKKKRRKKKKKKKPEDVEQDLYPYPELHDDDGDDSHEGDSLSERDHFLTSCLSDRVLSARPDEASVDEIANRIAFEKICSLESKCLNPQLELKKIFGAKTINPGRGPGKYGQRRVTRFGRLISSKDHWMPTTGAGISMELKGGKGGAYYFKFNHSEVYQATQRKFRAAVDSLNPDNIVNLLQTFPYHIDSRIQLSDLAKNAEDAQVAADLIEGAIYAMENAFESRFSITNPSCRLEYKYQENRAFHILLFKHLLFVGQRACYRTALELCKRLLLLDPDVDPLCVTLMVDFYAVKSGEYQWLIDLYNFWEPTRNLSQLPNWAYSVALATFSIVRDNQKKANKSSSKGQRSSLVTAEKKLTGNESALSTNAIGETNAADELLQYALLMFPAVLLPLLEKCGVHCDPQVMRHSYFTTPATLSNRSSLKILCDLYVWRSHHVWKDKDVMAWVERNVYAAIEKINAYDPVIRDYEAKRGRRYHGTPRNVLRHLILTDNKEHMGHIALNTGTEQILSYDPLPPKNSIDVYDATPRNPTSSRQPRSFLGGLLRSLIEDLNARQPGILELQPVPPPADLALNDAEILEQVDPAQAVPNPVHAGLHAGVATLLGSMRELLDNMRPGGVGPQPEEEGSEEDEGN